MVVALVADLKSGTSDVWELGAEAARIWPTYKRFAEDGCREFLPYLCSFAIFFAGKM